MAYHTRCIIIDERPLAIQIEQQIGRTKVQAWIPKSQMTSIRRMRSPDGKDEEISFSVPDWLSDEKGLN